MRCITRYKDTNLKAIHNTPDGIDEIIALYYQIQRYKFESNSQHDENVVVIIASCITRYKDTNLKAIHNLTALRKPLTPVVLPDTKIQI